MVNNAYYRFYGAKIYEDGKLIKEIRPMSRTEKWRELRNHIKDEGDQLLRALEVYDKALNIVCRNSGMKCVNENCDRLRTSRTCMECNKENALKEARKELGYE